MKKFDLEKAKAGAAVMTGDGRNARVIGERKHPEYPLIVAVGDKNGTEEIFLYTYEGRNYVHQACDEDLFMASIKHEMYANFYFHEKKGFEIGRFYDTEKEANANIIAYDGVSRYIKTIKVEWEE